MRRGSLKGFTGSITRVARIKGTKTEFFIKGDEDTTFEDSIREYWPDKVDGGDKKWRVVTQSGEDLTRRELSSYERIVIIEFID
jgi:hypothetical protein